MSRSLCHPPQTMRSVALPGLAREGATTGRRAMTGAWWGLLAAAVGVVVFWLLLSGFGGA